MKTIFFLFISLWLVSCNKFSKPVDSSPVDSSPVDSSPVDSSPVDSSPVDSGVISTPKICNNSLLKCSSGIDCSQGENCIVGICEYPICVSRKEVCQVGCGSPDCSILESDPSLITCNK